MRRWTLITLVLCIVLFGWTLVADRLTPYTSDASVRTFVVRIAPEVSGKVIEVAVRDNQIARTGDLLFRIDPTPFRIAVERAEAKLVAAGQSIGASTAAVDAVQAQLVQEIAQRDNVRQQAARIFELVRGGVSRRREATRRGPIGDSRGAGTARGGLAGTGAPGTWPPGRRKSANPRGAGHTRAGTPRPHPHHPAGTWRRCGEQPAALTLGSTRAQASRR